MVCHGVHFGVKGPIPSRALGVEHEIPGFALDVITDPVSLNGDERLGQPRTIRLSALEALPALAVQPHGAKH